MIVIGLISGTSADGIDAAVADVSLEDDRIRLEPLGQRSVDYPDELRDALWDALPPTDAGPEELCRLDALLGQAFGHAAAEANADLAGGRAELVTSHGQTIHHWVDDAGTARGTLQLGQPAWIAQTTGLPVVADLRNRDIAVGGHGAPLVAYPDVLLLADRAGETSSSGGGATGGGETSSSGGGASGGDAHALLNIGGIANLTLRRADGTALAFDTGPGNALMDAAVTDQTDGAERIDGDGKRAGRGRVDPGLLEALLRDPYYAQPAPKSTGKERFHRDYLAGFLADAPDVDGDDVIATLAALTAETIARAAAEHGVVELIASGGGTANPVLMEELRTRATGVAVRTIDDLGVPSGAKEAYWFAVLGFCTLHGIPGTVASCTGASQASLLGHLTPGADGFPATDRVEPPVGMRIVT